jgi:hemerythrin
VSTPPQGAITLDTLDQQHKRLFPLLESIMGASHSGSHLLPDLLSELQEAMSIHLSTEESFMLSIGYPQSEGHRWHHHLLLKDLEELIKDVPSFSPEKLHDLREIIVDHHDETDSHYVLFCKKLRDD